MKKIIALFFAVSLFLIQPAMAAQVNKVAAVVNGHVITMFDLQRNSIPELARMRLNPNNPAQKKQCDAVFRKVLDMMILDLLFDNEAKRLNIHISDADVDQEITRMYKSRGMTKKQFEQTLAQQKMSLSDVRTNARRSMVRQRIMGMEVGRRVVVTPEEIKAYYESHKSTMYDRRGLHMAVIVYHPKSPFREIAAKVKSGSISWKEASAKYSVFPKHETGGDTGEVQWDKLNDEWRSRLNGMKPGDVTDLFPFNKQLMGQVRLFRPNGDQSNRIMTLQEATPIIDGILRDPKAQGRLEDYSKQLKDKAVIDIRL